MKPGHSGAFPAAFLYINFPAFPAFHSLTARAAGRILAPSLTPHRSLVSVYCIQGGTSMRRRPYRSVLLVLGLLVLIPFARTASAQEASIIGQVTDASGGVLPGVTVTATSPALQVPQVTGVTDERGEYRLTQLPIGTYVVDYMLQGFVTVRRQDLRLTAGFTAKVDVALAVGGVAETLTV